MGPLRLEEIRAFVAAAFQNFGLNKQKETVRLLFEISRREQCDFKSILEDQHYRQKDFRSIKTFLLKKRFPSLTQAEREAVQYLQCDFLDLNAQVSLDETGAPELNPKVIYVEKGLANCALAQRFSAHFPDAKVLSIDSYKNFISGREFNCVDYNQRRENVFIIREQFDFFQPCPCAPGARSCGYHIMNAGFGCGYDCAYCFLQGYINAPGLVFPGNLDDFFTQFKACDRPGMRIGSGQFTDSLLFDHITGFSSELIRFFRDFPDVIFEFKTKSRNVDSLIKNPASPNIQISWTVNPDPVIHDVELGTASLNERLEAAVRCVQAGFRVGFHFDPIIFYDGWESDYRAVIERIFDKIPADRIGWISLGCLRMTKMLRQVIEARFPQSMILDAEQILEKDGKIRYPLRVRKSIYRSMIDAIRAHGYTGELYLCMEDPDLSRKFGISPFGCFDQMIHPEVDQALDYGYNQ